MDRQTEAQKALREASRCKRGNWGRALYEMRLEVQEGLVKDFALCNKHSAMFSANWRVTRTSQNTSQEATAVAWGQDNII